jgi:formamidase
VRFPGITHPGIIGTAPSMELLNIWNERERDVEENGLQSLKLCEVLHSRPLANLPTTKSCLLGKVINKYVLISVSYIFTLAMST